MEVVAAIADLPRLHPQLLWAPFQAALGVVLNGPSDSPSAMSIELDVSFLDMQSLDLLLDWRGVSKAAVRKIQKSYEHHRLVEMAAIGLAGLALYHACNYRIDNVAPLGSGADYLVESEFFLEVAGRSRRAELSQAWKQKWHSLRENLKSGFFLFVAEFETPSGRLAFAPMED